MMRRTKKPETWDMTLDEFISLHKSMNFKKYTQHTGQFSSRRQCGCDYYIYICLDTLRVVNPYTKKDKGVKYKSLFSSVSADDCKTKAWNYIQETIKI